MLLSQFEPYNRITQYQANHEGDSEAFGRLLFHSGWESILFWVLVVIVYGLMKSICGSYTKKNREHLSVGDEFWNDIFGKLRIKHQFIVQGTIIAILLGIILFTLVPSHPVDSVNPNMNSYQGTYQEDSLNNKGVMGLDEVTVTPHDIYGYQNNQLAFDFRYHRREFYHPWYLQNNCSHVGRTCGGTSSYTFKRDASNDSGVMLVGYYRRDPFHFAKKMTSFHSNRPNAVTEHDTYGTVHKRERGKPVYFDNNFSGKRKIVLPKPGTTMIIGNTDYGNFSINPVGARDIDDAGEDSFSSARVIGNPTASHFTFGFKKIR